MNYSLRNMTRLRIIFLLIITFSLAFHTPLPYASAASGDITPIRIQNHANVGGTANLEHDNVQGTYNSIVQVDSDTYALAYSGMDPNTNESHGFISTFTISSDGTTITEVDSLEHDADQHSTYNSLVHVDSDTYALAYTQSNPSGGLISTFDIDSAGTITPIRIANHANVGGTVNFEHDGGSTSWNSLVQVDSDTYALAYSGALSDGYIVTFTISSDGTTITEVDSKEHDIVHGQYNSLIQVDSDTYALAYAGENTDGYISTFDIDSAGTITPIKVQNHANIGGTVNLEHDRNAAKYNSLVKVDSETFALGYTGREHNADVGFISTFDIDSAGTITPIKVQNHANVGGTVNLEHDRNVSSWHSLIHVDSDIYTLAYAGVGGVGFISTFDIDSAGTITPIKVQNHANVGGTVNLEHDDEKGANNSIVYVDSETILLAYAGALDDGFISTFDIGIAKPSKVGTVSTTSKSNQVTLSWTAPTAGDSSITDYIIQYSTDDSTWTTFADGTSTGTTATVTGLANETTYYFKVAAVNSSGTGAFSSSSSTSTTSATSSSGGGGGKNNCDSDEFGNNNSLRVYQVMYDVDTYEVQVQAYSTCGSISAKITTPTQQSILGLSINQTLLDDRVAIYSGYLDESDEKFNISIQNKRDSFDETFYIYDKSIIKKYTGDTGYTSEQQGTTYQQLEPTLEPFTVPTPELEPTPEPVAKPTLELVPTPDPTPESVVDTSNDKITITGSITNYDVHPSDVTIRVISPNESHVVGIVKVTPNANGEFSTEFNVSNWKQDGHYAILVGYGSQEKEMRVFVESGMNDGITKKISFVNNVTSTPESSSETDTNLMYWLVIAGIVGIIFLLLYKQRHKKCKECGVKLTQSEIDDNHKTCNKCNLMLSSTI